MSAIDIQRWAHAACAALQLARDRIDALNVFPVPDGDTGTNVALTMEAACSAVDAAVAEGAGGAQVARALARGAMLGARGNSGVILSEYLRGISTVAADLPDDDELTGGELSAMLARGADLAYRAVSRPAEGTILTVARAAAQAAAIPGSDVATVARAAAGGARTALEATPQQLPALARAGVVDAGGQALVLVLDALVGCLTGEVIPIQVPDPALGAQPMAASQSDLPGSASLDQGPAFEVMFLLRISEDTADCEEAVQGLRRALEDLGDSVLVVGEGHLWNVHAHVDDVGAAIEAGLCAGRPHRIQVTALTGQPAPRQRQVHHQVERALAAVVHGPGVAAMLVDLGVRTIWAEPRQQPSTSEILEAILESGASEVIVLPSDKDTQPAAEAAARRAREEGIRAAVIPTRAVVQTLAAVAVHDPALPFDEDAVAMTRAAGATRYAAVTIASRRALTTAGPCQVGDALGVVDGDIGLVGSSVAEVSRGVLGAMLSVGGELVTLVVGSQIDADLPQSLADWLAATHPTVEVATVHGGQPLWPIIIGVE